MYLVIMMTYSAYIPLAQNMRSRLSLLILAICLTDSSSTAQMVPLLMIVSSSTWLTSMQ